MSRGENAPPPEGWAPDPRAIPDELWIDHDGPEGWKVRFPTPNVLIERHRDNCTLVDCRICTPPHIERGTN